MSIQVSRKETNIKDATNSKIIAKSLLYENLPCLWFVLCVRWPNEKLGLCFVV